MKVAIILFYNKEGKILLQDRRKMSKYGEEFGFFGGKIEEGETAEEALKREIEEELSVKINNFKLFKHYTAYNETVKSFTERFFFIAPMPDLSKVKVMEGELAIMKVTDTFDFKMIHGHKELLKEAITYLIKEGSVDAKV